MSEFKFSCPHCQQGIKVTPDYVGMQINCPACQTPIVVPEAPGLPASGAGPKSKLSKAPSTVEHVATSTAAAAQIVRKARKPKWGLYIGLVAGGAAVIAGIIYSPMAIQKYKDHQAAVAAEKAAAELAAHPPPPPPEPSAGEILKKVDEAYKALTSYKAEASSVATVDMSQINPTMRDPQTSKSKLSIQMARPDLYRFEWERQLGPKTYKGAIWCDGIGNYVRTASNPNKVKTRDSALTMGEQSSGAIGIGLAGLFFDETNSLATSMKNYSKSNNETIDGQKCYVITGDLASRNMALWVHKDDWLICQIRLNLGGKPDDALLSRMNAYQKAQAQMMAKMRGNVTETYEDVALNKKYSVDSFKMALEPSANADHKERKQAKSENRGERSKKQ